MHVELYKQQLCDHLATPAHTHLSTKTLIEEGNHSDFRNRSCYFDKHSSYQDENYGHTRSEKVLRNKTFSYNNTVAYKRDMLNDSLVRAVTHSLNLNNSNGVIYGKEGDNITIIHKGEYNVVNITFPH